MKRILPFLCVLVMLLSVLPSAAFAAEYDLQAIIDAGAENTIVLETDASDLTVTRDTTIDLNGHSIDGVTVTGGTLYCMDSQTADYTVADGVYGKVTNATGTVKAAEGYLQVGESFHAVNLDIYAMTLRASDVGVYYKSCFAADEVVAEQVESFGIALSVVAEPNGDNLETYCGYSQFTGFEAGKDANTIGTSTLLKNIMKAANSDEKNAQNAIMPVYGRAYIKTNQGYYFGETVGRSLQQQVEAVNAKWHDLTDRQKAPVLGMLERYASVMEGWNIPNILAKSIVVTRQVRLLPKVTTDLPEGALASAPGVVFSTAPYAYMDKQLFAGKHITKIGIPVKSVQALDENQTFTLSVVKTTANAYEYVSQTVLKLPKEELGDFATVNKWVYVDVDIRLGEDETLAFGMPTDTVSWGYATTKNEQYTFRSATGSWSSPINQSILFDVYATETIEFTNTQYGLAAVTESRALPNVLTDFPESAIASGNDVEFTTPPYSYTDGTYFSGSRITRIGIPVKTVKALDENQTFTLSVIKTGSGAYQYVSQHTLTLPLEQLGSSTAVNKWVYVDVDLTLAEDETLAFGGTDDTVTWAWKRGFTGSTYKFRNVNGSTSSGIFFDVYKETVLTYEAYQKELQEEQERLEAEQAQAKLDAQLKEALAGKGISILGDSISTFQGWSNNTSYNSAIGGNAIYYNGSRDGFTAVNETWWMQTITRAGLELVVNNSWSGDQVTIHGISRSLQLHNNSGTNPDIIAVYLGINDFRNKVTAETFRVKYDEMIAGMLEKYDAADVYLFTLLYTTNVSSGVTPANVVEFNTIIGETAEKYGCTLVDLYNDTGITSENLTTYMGDKVLHPNYAGMDRITQCFMDALVTNYLLSTEE